ncbi:MAG: molybdate ABC transporter substrate-binding protein [Woeseiaceae bacterium]|nr:molybdate ABC transporter substrate-binding protein [Woeseiaceae bacterium]
MRVSCVLLLLALPVAQAGQPVTVAVASNFADTATELAARFTDETGIEVRIVPGSTGKLYAQITNGAPFDVFLAADQVRPKRLEAKGYVAGDARFTYAIGELALWSTTLTDCGQALRNPAVGHVAIANPATAPYGEAAREYLETQGLWNAVDERLVYGENIMQAAQFVATGNAAVGFVASSLLEQQRLPKARCTLALPEGTYTPIRQDAVLLTHAADARSAQHFFAFLRSEAARDIVTASGYKVIY